VIDVHVPEPTHTWKDFFIHIATISVGLLIAIGLEQTVEAIHRAHERQALIDDLHAEYQDNLKVVAEGILYYQAMMDWDGAVLKNLSSAPVINGQITVVIPPPAKVNVAKAPARAVWAVAKASGKVALLPENLAEVFDRVDHEGEEFYRVNNRTTDATDKVWSVAEVVGIHIRAGAILNLTVAQRDELMDAFAASRVQEANSMVWLATLQGATQAALDGVVKREAMDDYMQRARQALP
jgi:hypothetical protein